MAGKIIDVPGQGQVEFPEGMSDADIVAAIKKTSAPTSRPTPVNAGLANFAASTLGLPGDIAKGVANAPQMLFGAAATALGKPDLAPTLNANTLGGAEDFRSLLRQTGLTGLSPDNPNPQSKLGTLAYDLTSRGGAVPGMALPAVGSVIGEKVGGPVGSMIGSMAPSLATAGYNAARAPALAREQAQNQVRDATLRPAQDAGYVLPPSAVSPTAAGNIAESFAGKAALRQEAELKNQQVTNRLVREEFGLPENTPITTQTLETIRDQAAQPYRAVSALSPVAAQALQRLRDARSEATINHRHYDMTGTPQSLRDARAADAQATMLEGVLERVANRAGQPQLVQELREARTQIAKTYDVERALNLGNGNVDAKIIGRALDRGRPLTGNLETIARFAEGPGRQFTREASAVPNPGSSALNAGASGVLGYEGFTHLGAPGLALAAIPFARGGVRQGLLSDTLQNALARPDYTPAMQPQSPLMMLLQQGALSNQRRP